jgi:hypothetical protein
MTPFPVLGTKHLPGCPAFVNKDALDERWAQTIHGQSLGSIAKRGGLSPAEIVMNVRRLPFHQGNLTTAFEAVGVCQLIAYQETEHA